MLRTFALVIVTLPSRINVRKFGRTGRNGSCMLIISTCIPVRFSCFRGKNVFFGQRSLFCSFFPEILHRNLFYNNRLKPVGQALAIWASGEIGIHARFRILCRKACGFESRLAHQPPQAMAWQARLYE